MQLHIVGFNWNVPGTIASTEVADYLQARSNEEITFRVKLRQLIAKRTGSLLVGVLITVKNQKKFTTFHTIDKTLRVNDLGPDQRLADFNFFVVNTNTVKGAMHGMYLYYHQSTGVTVFNALAEKHFKDMIELKVRGELAAAGLSGAAERVERSRIEQRYGGGITTGQICREEDWPELLSEFDRIKHCELKLGTVGADHGWLKPVSRLAKSSSVSVTFTPEARSRELVPDLMTLVNSLGAKSGRFVGCYPDELEERVIRIVNTPSSFDTYNFDEMVDAYLVYYDDVSSSPLLVKMVEVIRRHRTGFGPVT